jgi:hypothetical protein
MGVLQIEKPTLFYRSLLFHNLHHHPIQKHFAAFGSDGVPVASVNLPIPSTSAVINTAWLPEGMYWAVLRSGNLIYHKRVGVIRTRTIRRDE